MSNNKTIVNTTVEELMKRDITGKSVNHNILTLYSALKSSLDYANSQFLSGNSSYFNTADKVKKKLKSLEYKCNRICKVSNTVKDFNINSGLGESLICCNTTKTTKIQVSGSTLSRPEFFNKTIDEIKINFKLYYDGVEILSRAGITKVSLSGTTIDFGFAYPTNDAYLVQYLK